MDYKLNDYELIYMARENDDDSRNILFEKYLPIMKSIATEFYQKFNCYGYDYEDFLQEAMVAFQRSINNFDEGRDVLFYTFTTVCIRRTLLTFCRNISNTKKNISSKYFVPIEMYQNSIAESASSLNYLIDLNEFYGVIKKFIVDLPFENSCIFELRFNGFSYREIGKLLGKPASSVEFKNRKAKRKFEYLVKKICEKTV